MSRIPVCVLLVWGMHVCETTAATSDAKARPPTPTARKKHTETIQSSRHTYRITLDGRLDEDNTLAWRRVSGRSTMEWPLFQPNLSVTLKNVGQTDVRSAWLVVNGRDWYSIDTLLASIVEPDMSDREKAFAVYELFKKSFYHYNVAECRVDDEGYLVSDVLDPVKMFNMYENNGCSLHAINLATMWQRLGLEARVINFKSIHWVSEVFYDDAWHMLDADARVFFPKHDNETVAGMADWANDRYLLKRAHHSGDFAETDVKADLDHATHYLEKNSGRPYRAKQDHRMDIHLRPDERIVYRWDNIGKFHDNWRHKKYVPKFANGRFVYAPDFTKPHAEGGAERRANVSGFGASPNQLTIEDAKRPGELVYRFVSPYVIVGGTVELGYRRGEGAKLGLEISFDGKQWTALWQADKTGDALTAKVSLDAAIATRSTDAKYVYWLRYQLGPAHAASDIAVCRMVVTTDFQASINALPSLRLGVNEIAYRDATSGPHQVQITHEWQECDAVRPPPAPVPVAAATMSLAPTLRWQQPASAQKRPISHYRIQVRFDPKMRVPVSPNLERVFASAKPQWQVPVGWLVPNKKYYWRVRARDEGGIWSSWSKVASFTAQGPGLVKQITVDGTDLRWQPSPVGTPPARYEVFGSDERGFIPSAETRLAAVNDPHWAITLPTARRFYRVRPVDAQRIVGPVSAPVDAAPVRPRFMASLRVGENLARRAKVSATRTVRTYEVEAAVDGDPKTLWAGGQGTDLRLHPADFVLDLGRDAVVDTVILTTDRLKNQLRLKAAAVYAWAGDDWDGKPLFAVTSNTRTVVICRFPAVQTSRLCIRCLDTARGDHSFAHLNEIEIYGSSGPPKRKLTPSGLPESLGHTHDLAALDRQIEQLRRAGEIGKVRSEYLSRRRPLLVECGAWQSKLSAETKRTEAFAKQGAPPWAVALRDALARYRLWAHWWISHQKPDGQFGGQYGDDVELCCGWPVLCLAQDDPKTFDALKRLADGLWENTPSVKKHGFDLYSDVEHSAEPTSYSQPRMVALDWHRRGQIENSVYVDRCRQTVETIVREWMGRNEKGRLQFKSSWFGYDRQMKPKINPKGMVDIPQCAKALKPGLYVVWAAGDEQVKRTMIDYGRTWAEAALTEYEGKPRGLLPARIHWPSGKPEGAHTRFPPMRAMYFHLLACYRWTKDPVFLEPIRRMLKQLVVERAVGDIPAASGYGKPDQKEYAICQGQLALAASLWRRLSGDHSLDDPFRRWARRLSKSLPDGHQMFFSLDPRRPDLWLPDAPTRGAFRMPRYAVGTPFYLGWEVTGDKRLLVQACRNLSGDLTDQWGPLTYWFYDKTEPRVTSNDHLAHSIQWAAFALCQITTGGPGPIEAPYPSMAVTWTGGGQDVVPLVVSHDPDHVCSLLHNFRPAPVDVRPRFWELRPGRYTLKLGKDGNGDNRMDRLLLQREVTVRGPTQARVSLPAGGTCVLTVSRMPGSAPD